MKKLLTAAFAASALLAGAANAQYISCFGSFCSGATRSGTRFQTHTIGGYTSGTVGGTRFQSHTIGGYTSGTIGGTRFSCNTIGTYTSCR